VYGQHDAGWLSFYDFFRRIGIKEADRLEGLSEVARAAGWWWPFRGAVILTERPRVLGRDDEGRLHSDDGPAVAYPDGFSIWASHGVRVPRQVVEAPETLTVAQIVGEENAEVRRVMMERFGHERYLRESDAKLVQQDNFGKLWRVEFANDEPLVMVECLNSTPEPDGSVKTYFLRVPPSETTARGALAWTFDVASESYELEVQT
jgi:hypothetical protein